MNTLLVVDDEDHMRYLYRIFFSQEGYRVLEAMNADTANEILKHEHVDLILLDLRMPQANGATLYEVLQLFHKDAKVIVSSVYSIDQQKEVIKDAMDYFDKSQGLLRLLGKVNAALHRG